MTAISRYHEDVFYAYFRPFRHPAARFDIWGGDGLETFGDDLSLAQDYSPEYVWTVVDGLTDQWIIPGMHYVNRHCYLLTKIPHSGAPVEFRVSRNPRSLTRSGLARRITELHRVLVQYSRDKMTTM